MSVAIPLSKSSSVKCVQKLSKPRPLKLGSSGESENIPPLVSPVALTYASVDNINEDDVLRELESLHVSISNGNFEAATSAQVVRVCQLLKMRGAQMDSGGHRDQLDVYMVTLRSAARDDRLDVTCRTRLLEVLELRGLKWRPTEDIQEFYKKLEPTDPCPPAVVSSSSVQSQQQRQQLGGNTQQAPQQAIVGLTAGGNSPLAALQQHVAAAAAAAAAANGSHTATPAAMIIPQYIPLAQFTPLHAAAAAAAAGHHHPSAQQQGAHAHHVGQAAVLTNVSVPLAHQLPHHHHHQQQQATAAAAVQAVQQQVAAAAQAAAAQQVHAVHAAAQHAAQKAAAAAAAGAAASPFLSGELVRSSGKFGKPAKVPGRNTFMDEVIIRNADSGKVMGIKGRRVHMIEELSDTVISFQKVSLGARDRLVQITGPTEENILQAKQLIEETIRRNASPVRDLSSQDDSSGGSYDGPPSVATSPSGGALSPPHGELTSTSGLTSLPSGNLKTSHSLQHSLSTGDATAERDFTYMVQGGIKVSAPKQHLALAAKAVLEQHFSAAALMHSLSDHNFIHANNQQFQRAQSLVNSAVARMATGSYYYQQSSTAERDMNGGNAGDAAVSGDGWSSSGSSSDEDTYRRNASDAEAGPESQLTPAARTAGTATSSGNAKNARVVRSSRSSGSLSHSVATAVSTFIGHNNSAGNVTVSEDEHNSANQRQQTDRVNSHKEPVDNSSGLLALEGCVSGASRRRNLHSSELGHHTSGFVLSRDQLLDLAVSDLARKPPEDLDSLDPEFAVVIMRQDLAQFDVEAFRRWYTSGLNHATGVITGGSGTAHRSNRKSSSPPTRNTRSPPVTSSSANESNEETTNASS